MTQTNPDTISLTEAAKILGYASTRSVKELIKSGRLSAFKFPHRPSRVVVSRKEVHELLTPVLVSERAIA